jgi:hypothetical protein
MNATTTYNLQTNLQTKQTNHHNMKNLLDGPSDVMTQLIDPSTYPPIHLSTYPPIHLFAYPHVDECDHNIKLENKTTKQ